MTDDRVKVRVLRRFAKLDRVPKDVLERRAPGLRGGWTCDATQGGCGWLMATEAPPLQVTCSHCRKKWMLAGGMPPGGMGDLFVWYVPEQLD